MIIFLYTIFFLSKVFLSFSSNLLDFYPTGRNPNTDLSYEEFVKRRDGDSSNPFMGSYVKFPVNKEHVEFGHNETLIYSHTRIGISEAYHFVRGNNLRVKNPLGHLSFELTNDFKVGQTCSEIGIDNDCLFTTNAGFYDRAKYIPYGTLISGGKMLRDDYQYNAMFGMTKDGEYIIGYPSKEEIPKLNLELLITGIVWLVREGENFVGTSGKYERIFDSKLTDKSARTAIGHDKDGNLLLFQVDGKTWKDGYAVKEFADKLIQYGFVNAINVDGGGSVSFVDGSKLANGVTDSCSERKLGEHEFEMCERTLASVVCFHDHNVPKKDDSPVRIVEVIKEIQKNQTCDEEGIIESKDVVYVVLIFLLVVIIIFSFTVNAGLMVVLKKVQDKNNGGEAMFQIIDSDDTGSESTLDEQYFNSKDGNDVIYDSRI